MEAIFRFSRRRAVCSALLLGLCAGPAQAFNFELGEAQFSLQNEVLVGAAMRLEDRDPDLIGKLNLNPNLCPDDCIDLRAADGDASRNQRLIDAPGGFSATNGDNGDLNYDQYDLVSGQIRLNNALVARWHDVTFKVTGLGLYDPVNTGFDEYHPDNFEDVQPSDPDDDATAYQARHTRRSDVVEGNVGVDYDILEAFVSVPFKLFDRRVTVSVGEQRLRWGESTFNALNSLDQINPPDQNRLYFPGSDIASVFEPVGLAVVDATLTPNLAVQLVYQYDWERVEPASAGSFFSTSDIAGDGDYAQISLGQFSEDPNQTGTFTNDQAQLFSSTSLSAPVGASRGYPEKGGQYGIRINYFADWLNGGTELSFYGLNYHSRLPYLSLNATDASCIRGAPDIPLPSTGDIPGLGDALDQIGDLFSGVNLNDLGADALGALVACGGFNGSDATGQLLGDLVPGPDREPTPIDTLRPFLDYPEDIHMYGLSFNTNVGKWSLAGEYAFRPNLPLQVAFTDVVFAGVQPALPDENTNLILGVVPGNRTAAPDIVQTQYRNDPVQANELVRGFERFKTHQIDFTGIRIFSGSNPVGADQILLLAEVGATYIPNLPDPTVLPIEGASPNASHPSPGADGTGSNGVPNTLRLNPTRQTDDFADDFSWGYRLMMQFQYSDLLLGLDFKPMLAFFHDVDGVAPFPQQNFVEGRKQAVVGTAVQFTQAIRANLTYQAFFGGDFNTLGDRDYIAASVSYAF